MLLGVETGRDAGRTIELVRREPQIIAKVSPFLYPEGFTDIVDPVFVERHRGHIDSSDLNFGGERGEKCLAEAGITVLNEVEPAIQGRDHPPEHQRVGILLDVLPHEPTLMWQL